MKIVVALIKNVKGHVLIVKRKAHSEFGGYFEFPGGKVEEGESHIEALKREIREEVGLEITAAQLIDSFDHHYDTTHLHFSVFIVDDYKGEAQCLEAQPECKWVPIDTLSQYTFPPANHKMITLLSEAQPT